MDLASAYRDALAPFGRRVLAAGPDRRTNPNPWSHGASRPAGAAGAPRWAPSCCRSSGMSSNRSLGYFSAIYG